jgi:hypothetical protein
MQVAQTGRIAECERIVVTAGNGKVYDLGKPTSVFFKLRVFIYRIQRWLNG